MDQLTALKIFLKVAETGNFSTAARQLALSKSAVSKQVSALEEYLGAKLLYRTTRQVSLTQEGSTYVDQITPLIEALEEADHAIGQTRLEPTGTLRINAPLGFGFRHMAGLLADFHARYPKILVDLDLNDRFVDLVEEGYDLSIRIADRLDDSSLVARRLGPIALYHVASPAYLDRRGTPALPQDLPAHDCLRYRGRRGVHEWSFHPPADPQIQVRVKGPLICNNGDAIRQAALDGLGIARLPAFTITDDLTSGRLIPILSDWPPPDLSIYALYPPNRHLSVKVRAFIDYLADRFATNPTWAVRISPDQATTPAAFSDAT